MCPVLGVARERLVDQGTIERHIERGASSPVRSLMFFEVLALGGRHGAALDQLAFLFKGCLGGASPRPSADIEQGQNGIGPPLIYLFLEKPPGSVFAFERVTKPISHFLLLAIVQVLPSRRPGHEPSSLSSSDNCRVTTK